MQKSIKDITPREEKLDALNHIKEMCQTAIDDDTYPTHDFLILVIHFAKELIKSDF